MQVRIILGKIKNREVIAKGTSVKARKRLNKFYWSSNGIKVKGFANSHRSGAER